MHALFRAAPLALMAPGCRVAVPMPVPSPAGMVDRAIVVDGMTYRYMLFIPRVAAPPAGLPVVLFLHGMGERGSDNERPAHYSLGAYLRLHSDSFPAAVVITQVPADSYWTGQPARVALRALAATMREVHGNPRRVYLTGLSMGGYGSWELAVAQPELFAAAAIICGGVLAPAWDAHLRVHTVPSGTTDPYAWVAGRLGGLPVWVFHGDADRTVPVTESRRMVDALTRAGSDVRYTEYPGVGHNAWDRTYADPALWQWLLAHERRRARQ